MKTLLSALVFCAIAQGDNALRTAYCDGAMAHVQGLVVGETVTRSYSSTAANAMVADGSVTNNPVFNRDYEPMLATNATSDEVMYALAKYVPAVSSAVGGLALRDDLVTSIDLNGTSFRNGWGRNHSTFGNAWFHSDMKDMAYFYVYKLSLKMW
jgi:hypothetical protein